MVVCAIIKNVGSKTKVNRFAIPFFFFLLQLIAAVSKYKQHQADRQQADESRGGDSF